MKNKKVAVPTTKSSGNNYDGFIDSGAVELNLTNLKAAVKTMPESKEKKALWGAIENVYRKTFEAFGAGIQSLAGGATPIEA